MKKIFVILVALFLMPICIKAASINTSFNSETCILTINGSQTGHEATIYLFDKDNKNIGTKTDEIEDGKYSTYFVLAYDESKTISITISNESGTDEETKQNVSVPACTPTGLAPGKVDELFDGEGNSIKIKDKRVAFNESDRFELNIYDIEGVEDLIAHIEDEEEKEQIQNIFNLIMKNLGSYKSFVGYFEPHVRDNHNHDIDYSNYKKGFILKIAVPKEDYKSLKGLKFVGLDEEFNFSDELDYEYDEANEILSIKINSLNPVIAYIDKDYTFKDGTGSPIYNLKKGGTLTIIVDAPFENFVDIHVDNKLVDPKYYTAKSGSTVITFSKEFMSTLKAGNHDVTIGFNDGEAHTTIKVSEDSLNPKTVDMILKYVILFVVSIVGMTLGLMFFRKQTK